jgi:hypothetical protein
MAPPKSSQESKLVTVPVKEPKRGKLNSTGKFRSIRAISLQKMEPFTSEADTALLLDEVEITSF